MDAVWGAWGEWSGCDKPCNNGSFVRNRLCSKALYGGRVGCDVNSTVYVKVGEEKKPCNNFKCSGISLKKIDLLLRFIETTTWRRENFSI